MPYLVDRRADEKDFIGLFFFAKFPAAFPSFRQCVVDNNVWKIILWTKMCHIKGKHLIHEEGRHWLLCQALLRACGMDPAYSRRGKKNFTYEGSYSSRYSSLQQHTQHNVRHGYSFPIAGSGKKKVGFRFALALCV